jgi:deazaflavin-dependent oxidoreductase (nitroreductase family)
MATPRRDLKRYERILEDLARTPAGTWYVKTVAPVIDPPLLRLTGGRLSSVYPVPVMLLTTTGAKTGKARSHPLLYVEDGDGLVLVASNYGSTRHPAWYRNLRAHPVVEVLAGRHSGTYTATEITDPAQRDQAWARAIDLYAGYGDYAQRAGERTIPLIRLTRTAP